MCYYCHRLKNNVSAPSHRSKNCRDRSNTHSKYYRADGDPDVRSTRGRERAANPKTFTQDTGPARDLKACIPPTLLHVRASLAGEPGSAAPLRCIEPMCRMREKMATTWKATAGEGGLCFI
jgi:hypothetical protein